MSEKTRITAVTGSTRCGTTLMMGMLHVGGVPAYADNYVSFETSRILDLPGNTAWLDECHGKALKLLEPLYVQPLPVAPWQFILMRRNPVQQARSQVKFLRLAAGEDVDDAAIPALAQSIRTDMPKMRALLKRRGPVLEIAFEHLLADPLAIARRIERFLGRPLDVLAMAERVVPRGPESFPGLLELSLESSA